VKRRSGSVCRGGIYRSEWSFAHGSFSNGRSPEIWLIITCNGSRVHYRKEAHRRFKTAYELQDIIVEEAMALLGPWPAGMTLFVFEDAYGWTASVSRPLSEAENFYRVRALDLITTLRSRYDLDARRLPGPDELW
jgi:hypothetical protein